MQVNKVQSPSFGQLFINPKAEEKLEVQSHQTLLDLQQAKKDLKNTKFYHIYIGEDLKARMVSVPNAYWGSFNNQNYDTRYNSEKIDPNAQIIKETSKHSLFEQYGIFREKKGKDGLVRYRISGYNKLEQNAQRLDNISEDLGLLTRLTLDFDKAAKTNDRGIVVKRTNKQLQERTHNEVKDLMKSCSTNRKEI